MDGAFGRNYTFPAAITQTFVNGNCVYINEDNYGKHVFDESIKGQRLSFQQVTNVNI